MKPTWVMSKLFSGEVNDAFVKAAKRAFPGLMVDGGSTGEVLVLADFFDDPRWNGGPEYDVYFRRLGPDRWSITVPATNGGKLKAFLARELRVVPQEGF